MQQSIFEERHEREQYFFSRETLNLLAKIIQPYKKPCLLCAPTLGVELERQRREVCTLDIDERFHFLNGFKKWNIWRPEPLDEVFGFLLVDPPFSIVSLSDLFDAVKILTKGNFKIPLMISNHRSRVHDVEATFAPFTLRLTNIRPTYMSTKSDVAMFANFPTER